MSRPEHRSRENFISNLAFSKIFFQIFGSKGVESRVSDGYIRSRKATLIFYPEMAARAIEIQYNLSVSAEIEARRKSYDTSSSQMDPHAMYTFQITGDTATPSAFYQSLGQAVKRAIEETGHDLTAWRDAVGEDERPKEQRANAAVADVSDESEEDDESPE